MPGRPLTYQQLLGIPDMAALLLATVLSRLAGRMVSLALVLYALARTESPGLAGWLAFAAVAPGLAISPVAGALIDRSGAVWAIGVDMAAGAACLLALAVLDTLGLVTALAAALGVPHVELDALHWEADWQALTLTNPAEFARRVAGATDGAGWVVDGNYLSVRDLTWGRATHLVWLDYGRAVIMARVIRGTLYRALFRPTLWSGTIERWRAIVRPSHPIRWAWSTWRSRRTEYERLLRTPSCAPEGNGCAERFIRTLKENLLWVRHFETIAELRQALLKFRETYNNSWLIERHGYLTPDQFRQNQLQPIAAAA